MTYPTREETIQLWDLAMLETASGLDAMEYFARAIIDRYGAQPAASAEPLHWIPEDELPEWLPTPVYDALFPYSRIDNGIREFPIYGPAPVAAQPLTCRTLTDQDMDRIAGWLNQHEAGDIGWTGLCERIIQAFAVGTVAAQAQPFDRNVAYGDGFHEGYWKGRAEGFDAAQAQQPVSGADGLPALWKRRSRNGSEMCCPPTTAPRRGATTRSRFASCGRCSAHPHGNRSNWCTCASIQPHHAAKLRVQLTALNQATGPQDMAAPAWGLHPLHGALEGHFSVWVNGNWRMTFTFEGTDAILVDYQDYH